MVQASPKLFAQRLFGQEIKARKVESHVEQIEEDDDDASGSENRIKDEGTARSGLSAISEDKEGSDVSSPQSQELISGSKGKVTLKENIGFGEIDEKSS